ncbi:MAG: nicotinate-nucleotide adenylyltransferase [Gemmatimonadaceae bacterium]|nr:nicotinate-nucleotide adenylyltransferase [Acetobacteraceae bacterium]
MTEADPLPAWGHHHRIRVGVLGGSFNPAHAGHLHIARLALRRLRLDQVWLLVSPGNPLKQAAGMAGFADRLASARRIADGRRIVATGIEVRLRTHYTHETLRALRLRFPRVRFVWIMGADNLVQLPQWQRWMGIARTMPFAVMPRPTYNQRALAGQAAHRLRPALTPSHAATSLPNATAPAWSFLPARQNALSATALRAAGDAFHLLEWPPVPHTPAQPRTAAHQGAGT